MTTIDQSRGEVRVFTFKEGLLSAVAHDLELAVERFSITWDDAMTSVSASFDARSLRVLHPVVRGRPSPGTLSARDLSKIEANVADDVLRSASHPEIRFASSTVTKDGDGFVVRGSLTLVGRTSDVRADVRRVGERFVTELELDQTRWGITPFSAMMGTLKIKPVVRVTLSAPIA